MTKKSKQGTCKVFLTHRAVADLIGIEEYTVAKWRKSAATKYIAKFEKAFSLIELNADLPLPNPSLSDSLLFFRVEKHLMACIRMSAGVAILTIIHANRDLPNILHDLAPSLKEEVIFLRGRIGE